MTTEEKARSYDEALTIAKRIISKNCSEVEKLCLKSIFPELAESEDEKMINELQGFLDSFGADYFGTGEWQKFHDWLEKQKEQKPAECIEDSVKFEEGFKTGRESGLRDGQKYVLNNLDSYGLCKPAEWSEEDERKYQCIRNILLADMDKRVGSWKYSEILEWYEKRGIGRYTNSEPHWKPSEQEKGALRTAICVLTEERNFPKTAEQLQAILDAFDGKETRKEWKPSEEQMEAFSSYIKDFQEKAEAAVGGWNNFDVMIRLYEQLKKL